MNEIIVGRRTNSGLEYLLNENGEEIKFPTADHAIRYMKQENFSEREIRGMEFIYTNESRECKCHLCEKRDDCFIAYKFQRLPRRADGTGSLGMCPKL